MHSGNLATDNEKLEGTQMKKRLLALLGGYLLSLLFMVGCGVNNNDVNNPAPPTNDNVPNTNDIPNNNDVNDNVPNPNVKDNVKDDVNDN